MTTETEHNEWTIRRYDSAEGTNLADKSQPIIRVSPPGSYRTELLGRWTTLCIPSGTVNALEATDAQIVEALSNDQPIFG